MWGAPTAPGILDPAGLVVQRPIAASASMFHDPLGLQRLQAVRDPYAAPLFQRAMALPRAYGVPDGLEDDSDSDDGRSGRKWVLLGRQMAHACLPMGGQSQAQEQNGLKRPGLY